LKVVNEKPFKAAPYGLGVRKGDPEWLDFVNATLTKMRETGEHKRLLQKWFGKAMALVLEHQNY
jgi:ABC-type amino acid transport substrate-binding protein